MTSDIKGIFTHLYDLAFKFTSRPDYYSRLWIFRCMMRSHGCDKAHVEYEPGKWRYDWTLDERYAAYAKIYNSGKSFDQYTQAEKEAYGRYYAAA